MGRAERERNARRQRMLARSQGNYVPGTTGNLGIEVPKKIKRSKTPWAAPEPIEPVETTGEQTTNLRPIHPELQKRQRRRRSLWTALFVAAVAAVFVLSGALTASLALLGDGWDSIALYLTGMGSDWPVNTGITDPLQIEELGGGFVELSRHDVVVYSSYGSKVRAIQPNYARPTLAVGSNRFVIYNRAGSELRVESRTQTLYTENFPESILLCAVSPNGTVAVVTESNRFAAELEVFDPYFRSIYTWQMSQSRGTPIAVAFANDNRRFAAGTISAVGGQLCSRVYLMDTGSEEEGPCYEASSGSMVLRLQWLTSGRLLAVFDTYAAILNPSTMTETARYDFGGATLQSFSVGGKQTALLLNVRGGNDLVTLDESLAPMAEIPAGQATSITATEKGVYLLCADRVQCYGFDGIQKWEQLFDTTPLAVLKARQMLVFTGANAELLKGA